MLEETPPPVAETPGEPATASSAAPSDAASLIPSDTPSDAPSDTPSEPSPAAPKLPDLPPAACAARLTALFPALFTPRGPVRPLKLRIQADVQQRAPGIFTKKSLSIFLHRHTTSTAYLIGLTQAPHRFDLDGAAAGEITVEHREAATAELTRRRGLHEARRAAEREAQGAARRAHEAQDEARRERAGLLRAFESSTLTRANFCALKGIAEDGLDAQLELARQEREQRSQEARIERPAERHAAGRPDDRRPPGPRQRPQGNRPRR